MEIMVAENPVVIFSKSTCCMCHCIKRLFYELGANPKVYELDEIENGPEIEAAIPRPGRTTAVPAVYLGGELEGGAREIMVLHIDGLLRPKLVNVGALYEFNSLVGRGGHGPPFLQFGFLLH